jgi:hypothetical protein
MTNTNQKIIVIDDNFSEDDYLLIALREKYGEQNVLLFRTADDGLEYIMSNLANKMVVLLDVNLGANKERGDIILQKIRSKTSLVSVIMMSASLQSLTNEELRRFINHHAIAAINSNDSVKANLPIIDEAVRQLGLRVDCAIEAWILSHSPEDRNKPYLITRNGEKYSLNLLLEEIRKNSSLGIKMQENILNLAVELLARQKEKL